MKTKELIELQKNIEFIKNKVYNQSSFIGLLFILNIITFLVALDRTIK